MQIGVISDVHGNIEALTAVWREFAALGVAENTVINAGDSVGYGDHPEECVSFLRAHENIVSVLGNYDKNIARFPTHSGEFYRKWGVLRPEKYEALECDSALISQTSREWLAALPKEARLTIEGIRIVVTHYAPGSKTGLGPWDGDEVFEEIAATADADVVVGGHTHAAFIREASGVLFINPGATGRSGTNHCPFALLTIRGGRAKAELRKVTLP